MVAQCCPDQWLYTYISVEPLDGAKWIPDLSSGQHPIDGDRSERLQAGCRSWRLQLTVLLLDQVEWYMSKKLSAPLNIFSHFQPLYLNFRQQSP